MLNGIVYVYLLNTKNNIMKTFTIIKDGLPFMNFLDQEVAELFMLTLNHRHYKLHTVETNEQENIIPEVRYGAVQLFADDCSWLDWIEVEVDLEKDMFISECNEYEHVSVKSIKVGGILLNDVKISSLLTTQIEHQADDYAEQEKNYPS